MRFLLSIVMLAVVCSARAQGTSQAILGYTNAIVGLFSGTAGWTFQVTNAVTVTELGCLANFFVNNPTANQVQVGLWASDHSLLASSSISPTNAQVELSLYDSIAPVLLTPGQPYYIGVYYPGGLVGLDVVAPTIGGLVFASTHIVSLATAYSPGGFTWPAMEAGTIGAAYLGPNFRYVPEPSSIVLFGLGVLWLAVRRGFKLL